MTFLIKIILMENSAFFSKQKITITKKFKYNFIIYV